MKKHILHISLLLFTCIGWINLVNAQDLFSKFEKNKNISSVIVNQKMFDMMSNVKVEPANNEEKRYFELIKKLSSLKVFNTKHSVEKNNLKDAVEAYYSQGKLKEFASKKDSYHLVTIYINKEGNEKEVNELILLNEGLTPETETIVLIITGQFSINELSSLTQKMNLPLGDSLQKL
ncbi:DUF4252 domain-containing protein [Myroides indicus]|uniref:Uncharacterized protein DUF4252 n=1 Tax=Myroides indicus TaxID=1323422 RepID=A0A4R7EUQ0_9FLAO|nr:DUF4252 domain-containing protein [Myroides indicus]TDS57263.1 uncharacterized protein DUF4252 [Myroides indicus]